MLRLWCHRVQKHDGGGWPRGPVVLHSMPSPARSVTPHVRLTEAMDKTYPPATLLADTDRGARSLEVYTGSRSRYAAAHMQACVYTGVPAQQTGVASQLHPVYVRSTASGPQSRAANTGGVS